MKILVTGAAGFIGSHLAERLHLAGHEVVGLDCFSDYYDPALKELNARALQGLGIRLERCNLVAETLGPHLDGVEAIYHLAAQPGNSPATPFSAFLNNNVVATARLLEAARAVSSLALFVNVSTSSVYGFHATDSEDAPPKPTSPYGVTKLAAEQLVLAAQRAAGFPACSIRIFSVIGPRERPDKLYHKLIRCIVEGTEFPLFEGSEDHSRSFTFVGDAVDAFARVIDRREVCLGEIINIGSDEESTTREGMAIIEELLGKKARIARKPPRPGDQLRTKADITKARRLLDYAPHTSLREALRAQVEWYLREVAKP